MTHLARREFLKKIAVGAAALAAAQRAPAAAGAPRPNFLFILTDDQRWDAMGVVQREMGEHGRFPWLKTPNLDRLAAEGVRFRNAFVVNSLCAPSRATFLTGQYGHANGVVNNHTAFPLGNVTHASLLRAAGYRTAYCGKWHMGQQPERPGFDFAASFLGQGRYTDCPIVVNGVTTPSKGWVDDVTTDYLLQFLRENKDRPFCATIGYKAVHGPCTPPERRRNDYADARARAVPNLAAKAAYATGHLPPARRPAAAAAQAAPDGAGLVPAHVDYFRCVAAMDDNVGRLLAALDELKLSERTVVVFAGDNGYYLGEHGLGDKRSAYEESLRIPMLLRYPPLAAKGATVDSMVLNTDLAPTFLDLAGLPVPAAMHGRSWRPLLQGGGADWRKSFFYCYFFERGFGTPMTTAVRTETAKLVRYPGHDDWTELFDLKADPFELKNLYGDPAAAKLRAELEDEYERQKQAIAFRVPDGSDAPGEALAVAAAAAPAGCVLDYRFDAGDAGKAVDASPRANHGAIKAAQRVEGRDGHKALRFDGAGCIDIQKSASLNPARRGWTVEIACKPGKPDGVLIAHGGKSNGYCLALEKGRPVFTVVSEDRAQQLAGPELPVGWVRVQAKIDAPRRLVLSVDGAVVAEAKLEHALAAEPHDRLQVGADLGSCVRGDHPLPPFTGLIESVRITAE